MSLSWQIALLSPITVRCLNDHTTRYRAAAPVFFALRVLRAARAMRWRENTARSAVAHEGALG